MCIVCGTLWKEEHWAEIGASARFAESDGRVVLEVYAAERGQRLRDRALRSRFANLLLRRYGLQLQDWEGSSYILRDQKGNAVVVPDLPHLWRAAEQMLGRPLDPLDAEFLDALKHQIRSSKQ